MRKLDAVAPRARASRDADNVLTFDKVTDVFNSGTMHDENQPAHLHVAILRFAPIAARRIRQSLSVLLSGRRIRTAF